jgi:ABC-2 type transport system permease protein
VVKKQFGTSAPVDQVFIMYVQMLNFILVTLVFLSVTNVTMVFKRSDLRMRNLCAPLKPRSLNLQQVLACAAMSTLVWILLATVGIIMYGGNLGGVDTRIIVLMLLNSFVITIFALALAALASNFVNSGNAQNAVANIMTLALCFLGGVFVPRYMLSDGILAVSRFLPTYWNVIALERATELTSFDTSTLAPFWQAIAIQLAFAAAVFCVSLLVGKHINQSERFISSVRTELEG